MTPEQEKVFEKFYKDMDIESPDRIRDAFVAGLQAAIASRFLVEVDKNGFHVKGNGVFNMIVMDDGKWRGPCVPPQEKGKEL